MHLILANSGEHGAEIQKVGIYIIWGRKDPHRTIGECFAKREDPLAYNRGLRKDETYR
jgi:hypothetical protein